MNRLLITGGGGFIGRHCLPLLADLGAYEVHAVSSRQRAEAAGVAWHTADLLEPDEVERIIDRVRPSHLLHLAWYTEHGKYWSDPENLQWVRGTLDLVQRFGEGGGRRAVMAGTCAEYDWRYGYCREQITPLVPASLYGVCKNAARSVVERYCQDTGISWAWGRVFFAYGPHEPAGRLVPSVIAALSRREPARCSHGRQLRDFLHVRDVAAAFVALLDSDVQGAVNIASGQPVAVRDVARRIAAAMESDDLLQLGALQARVDEPPLLVADVGRLTNEVGWEPTLNLDAGLRHTILWYEEQEIRCG
jgi:nucleoside-diphosphate-sugar epimerase